MLPKLTEVVLDSSWKFNYKKNIVILFSCDEQLCQKNVTFKFFDTVSVFVKASSVQKEALVLKELKCM